MLDRTIRTVEDAVLNFYLLNKEPISIWEIRKSVQDKLGATIIRRVLRHSTRIVSTTKDMKIMSKTTPGVVHQWRSVDAFQPSREWLVEIINTTRLELPHYIYDRKYR